MTLADTAHGSDWILWGVFAVFVILTTALLSGHGSKFISGYNTASKEEKARYEKAVPCIRNWNGRDRYSPSDNRTI